MLSVSGLSKTYGNGVRALRDVTFAAPAGLFGLLGPNGAGKSTLLQVLATLAHPDAGSAMLDGVDLLAEPDAARELLGYLPQDFGLYGSLTAEEMLDYLVALKGTGTRGARRSEVSGLLERVNLTAVARRRVSALSGGMRQRLGIAQALAGGPRLVLLDEPTSGLDPEEKVRLYDLLADVARDAVVVLSTHSVADLAHGCGRLAVLHEGRVALACTPADALAALAGSVWEGTVDAARAVSLRREADVIVERRQGDRVLVRVRSGSGSPCGELSQAAPTLEDVYFGAVRAAGRG